MAWWRSIPIVATSFDQASQPDLKIDDIFQINPQLLAKHEIENIIFDIDQTLVPQGHALLNEKVIKHLKFLGTVVPGTICFLTNEPNDERNRALKEATGFSVVAGNWRKPEPDAFANALAHLGVAASKKVAMVGDRRWTDVLGANKAGLFSILVNPISPSLDKFGASLARSAEIYSARTGKFEYIAFLGSIASITGLSVISIWTFLTDKYYGSLDDHLAFLNMYRLWWIAAFGIFSLLYFRFISFARSQMTVGSANPVATYFNTYPLALRYLASFTLIALISLGWLKNDQLVQVSLMFCLFTLLTLAASLFPFYHNQGMRIFRIGVDILLVFIMASTLDGYYKFIALAYLAVPIATSSRHMNLAFNLSVVGLSVGILLYVLSTFERTSMDPRYITDQGLQMIVVVFVGIYVMTALTIRFEYRELTTPFSEISRQFEAVPQNNRLGHYLRSAAKSINCSGVVLIKLFEGGVYHFSENNIQFGRISKTTATEIGNFLHNQMEKLESLNLTNQPEINRHSVIIRDIERLIWPPLKNGVTAAVAIKIPQVTDVYLIALNPLSRNGTSRSNFWIHHVAIIKVLALTVGASLNTFITEQDFTIS